jgi:alkylation response protein AidB-like acyl-CoA dehydrogenase
MDHPVLLPQYSAAQALEYYLGDPEDPALPFSYRSAAEADERNECIAAAGQLLDEWGMNLYYIPESLGGRLQTFEQAFALGRMVSRRDLSATVDHSISFLGFAFIWLAGSPELKERAAAVIQNRGRIALGLTERDHGGDLAGCACRAELYGDRYLITGEKWLINNATRGQAISLFARTNPNGGPRGFSFLFVDKTLLPDRSFKLTPKVLTHGIRGVDISGIRFDEAPVDTGALIGTPGAGLEIALKGLQVTRTMCANLSLGALDTALRIALDFALSRRIYGSTVFDIPAARGALAEAFLDLLIGDCVSIAGARALHVVPGQMSVHSAIVKFFVPVTCERALQSLSVVLGARHYLREQHWHGMFQKLLRDIGIVALFDGSTAVNLNIISSQLLMLCEHHPPARAGADTALRQIFNLALPLPEFEPDRLTLFNKGVHDVVQAIPELHRWIERAARQDNSAAELAGHLQSLVQELKDEYACLRGAISANPAAARHSRGQTPEMFEMARRYCVMHAAAACVLLWAESRSSIGGFFARGEWLHAALLRLLGFLRPRWDLTPLPALEAVSAELTERFHSRRLLSVVPLTLAGGRERSLVSGGSPYLQ